MGRGKFFLKLFSERLIGKTVKIILCKSQIDSGC